MLYSTFDAQWACISALHLLKVWLSVALISRTFESTTKIFTIHILAFRLLIMEKCNTKYYKRDCHTDALRNYRLNSYYCLGALLLESRSKWSDFINNSKPDICWTFLLYVFPCKPVYILDTYLPTCKATSKVLCRVFMIYINILYYE